VAKSMLEFLTGFTSTRADRSGKALESWPELSWPAGQSAHPGLVDYFVQAVRDYRIDGVIAVVKRTCGLIPA